VLKKVIVGILIAVLVGAVVLGAYSYWRSSNYGPVGRGRYAAAAYYGDCGRGQDQGYRSDEPGRGGYYGLPRADEWLTVSGEIAALDQTTLAVQTDDGQTLLINLGPPRFWESQDVSLEVGEQVTVRYFAEDGEFQAGEVTVEATGDQLLLRDSDGRPMWAGRGQGRGQYGRSS
jgi:hypothetical protein